jgi:hypothetical protein
MRLTSGNQFPIHEVKKEISFRQEIDNESNQEHIENESNTSLPHWGNQHPFWRGCG